MVDAAGEAGCPSGAAVVVSVAIAIPRVAPQLNPLSSNPANVPALGCSPGSPGPLSVPLQPFAQAAAFAPATAPMAGNTLWCDLFAPSSARSLAHAALPVSIGVTRWPILADVVVVLAVGGRLKPAFGPPINATASLIRGCILATRGRPVNCTDVTAAALVPAAVLFAAQESVGYGLAPPLTSARSPFTTTLSTATWLALRASAPPADGASGSTGFSQSSTVTVGGVSCTVTAASSDGAWAVVQTPLSASLCAATGDCGYESLAVTSTVNLRESYRLVHVVPLSARKAFPLWLLYSAGM